MNRDERDLFEGSKTGVKCTPWLAPRAGGQINFLSQREPLAIGLPGGYSVGAFHNGNSFKNLTSRIISAAFQASSSWGQQMIWRPPRRMGKQAGSTVWDEFGTPTRAPVTPCRPSIGQAPLYQGLISRRSQGSLNTGWVYGGCRTYCRVRLWNVSSG